MSYPTRIIMKSKKIWINWASVEELSIEWNLSKRRIQQIIAELRDEGTVEMIIGVFDSDNNPYARPLYRRVEK